MNCAVRSLIGAIALSFCLGFAARADELCDEAGALAGFQDHYAAIDRETGRARQDAAVTLLAVHLPAIRPSAIVSAFDTAGIPIEESRLRDVLAIAAAHARQAAAGQRAEDPDIHEANRKWLSGLIIATNCPNAWRKLAPPSAPSIAPQFGPTETESDDSMAGPLTLALLGLAGLIAAFGLRRTRFFRKGELRRLPRLPVSLLASVLVDGDTGSGMIEVRASDLSHGGAKLAWPGAPPTETHVTVEIAGHRIGGSIVWRNDYFAGLLFDTHLAPGLMDEFLSLGASTPAGQSALRQRAKSRRPS